MLDWITANATPLNLLVACFTALVWLAYLQLLYSSVSRQRRPMILISRSIGQGRAARLFVSNMGAEPIYVSSMIADLETEETNASAIITDDTDIEADDESDALEDATTEGPLKSGEYLDMGSFGGLMDRVARYAQPRVDVADVYRLSLTVAASTGHSALISAGTRSFRVRIERGKWVFYPETISTVQLRGMLQRRRLRGRLEQNLAEDWA